MAKANIEKTRHKERADFKKAKRLKKKTKKEEKLAKVREAITLGLDPPPKQIPNTIESLREPDESAVGKDDLETRFIQATDEFSSYFKKSYVPKILITSCQNPTKKTRLFLKEISRVIPNSEGFHRRQSTVKKIIADSKANGYTDVMIINEHQKEPSSLMVCHLPDGPTSVFRLSSVQLTKNIKRDWKEITSHRPEVILNNFTTSLGENVSRMLGTLFHHDPQFKGRRVVTLHNQRDYIFVRHHRYEFKSGQKAALRELGPRFTLKLRSLQKGTFDSKTGEYEWYWSDKRHELESRRRRFHL